MVEVAYFKGDQVDIGVFQLILDQELFDPTHASENTGLYGCCKMFFDEDFSELSHVWIAKQGDVSIGICAIRPLGDCTVNVYVKPEWRRTGVGSLLLEKAVATNVEFGAIHTVTGKPLFEKYGIADYKTNPPWMNY